MDAIVQLHTGLKEVNKRYDECQSIICEQNNLITQLSSELQDTEKVLREKNAELKELCDSNKILFSSYWESHRLLEELTMEKLYIIEEINNIPSTVNSFYEEFVTSNDNSRKTCQKKLDLAIENEFWLNEIEKIYKESDNKRKELRLLEKENKQKVLREEIRLENELEEEKLELSMLLACTESFNKRNNELRTSYNNTNFVNSHSSNNSQSNMMTPNRTFTFDRNDYPSQISQYSVNPYMVSTTIISNTITEELMNYSTYESSTPEYFDREENNEDSYNHERPWFRRFKKSRKSSFQTGSTLLFDSMANS